jgi:metallophosphoesterase (TIGR03767 family)
VEQHFALGGAPHGHGFTNENRAKGTAYYAFDQGPFRMIVMDTVNPNGYADGSIDRAQFAWLKTELANSAGKIVMVFSHHTSFTMKNTLIITGGELQTRINGTLVLEELLKHESVVAWVNGHTHKNQVLAHARPGGNGGLWEINTAAHIDWPMQSRIIEVTDNGDGTLSIFTTIVDHSGPQTYPGGANPLALAGLARELAMNDPQDRTDSKRGQLADRNLELVVQNPL